MAGSQTKEDKEHFFADLERLCDSESDSDYDETTLFKTSRKSPQKKRNTRPRTTIDEDVYNYTSKPFMTRLSKAKSVTPARQFCNVATEVIDLTSPVSGTLPISPAQTTTPASPAVRAKRKARNTTSTASAKRLKKDRGELQLVPQEDRIFQGLVFFFIPNDDIAKSRKVRILRAREHGARWARHFDDTVTHIIVEQQVSYCEAQKAFADRHIPENKVVVRSTWFSECLANMCLKDARQSRFRLLGAPAIQPRTRSPHKSPASTRRQSESATMEAKSPLCPSAFRKNERREEAAEFQKIVTQVRIADQLPLAIEHDDFESFSSTVSETSFESLSSSKQDKQNKGFQCMESNTGTNDNNPNKKTIVVLQEMARYYDRTGDHWRTTAYRKAIGALRKQHELISTREQALAIPQIGARLADKVEEIVMTNRLRRLEATKDDPYAKVLQLFMGVYDVGYKQASQWILQGHRTLEDLVQKASLSRNQRIGIAHYDDFLQRIPRAEVSQHGSIVQRACQAIDRNLKVIIGGSYRRGSPDSGDIDLIITKRDADLSHIRTLVMMHVIPALTKADFLKCALASSSSSTNTGSKWHGASCLPKSKPWRRIDLLFVPDDEIGAALIYFTGNDIFNRSIRLLASKKGMRLNQHGLYKDVMRGQDRTKLTEGTLLEGRNEKRIFEILGVPWREPWERKC